MRDKHVLRRLPFAFGAVALFFASLLGVIRAQITVRGDEFNDSHFHLTNYIQEGIEPRRVPEDHGQRASAARRCSASRCSSSGRTRNSGDFAPTYYLQSDAPLYYYSFTDAYIASVYRSLSKDEQARFDPMITGFNPADMYGVDHIRRVLQTFPGVFSGHRRVHAFTRNSSRRRLPAKPPA